MTYLPSGRRMRRLTRALVLLASTALVATAVTACAPPEKKSADSDGGGTLTLGGIGGSRDSLDPYKNARTELDTSRVLQLYNGLTGFAPDGSVTMDLAESMTPNDDNTVWTVHLRPDVKLHGGGTFSADDVIESVKRMMDPDNAYGGAAQISFVDPDKVKKIDDLTVEFDLDEPYGVFDSAWSHNQLLMAHWDGDEPVGTGPFERASFTAGQQSVFTRFDDYWGEKPGFKTLKIVDFQDQSAVTNALRGGQIDIASTISFTDADTIKDLPGFSVLESKEGAFHLSLDMRTDIEPFNDPRVAEAMKLIANREQIVENVFGGYATVGNDFDANASTCPAPDVPQRKQDIAKAKELLADAGQSDLTIDLVTDDGLSGMLSLAQVYAQQAAEAGVTIHVKKMDTASFLNNWLEWPFVVDVFGAPYTTVVKRNLLPGGSENTTHFDDAEFKKLAADLFSTSDKEQQCDDITKMHQIEYERSGVIVPAISTVLTAHNDRVQGLKPDAYGRSAYMLAGVTVDE